MINFLKPTSIKDKKHWGVLAYRKKRADKQLLGRKKDQKLFIIFWIVLITIAFWNYYLIGSRKTFQQQFKESKTTLVQMDLILESEHIRLNTQHYQWLVACRTRNITNDIRHNNLQENYAKVLNEHAALITRYKKMLERYFVLEMMYQDKDRDELTIKERYEVLLNDFDKIKYENDSIRSFNKSMKTNYLALLKAIK
ncbi:MAG: hypothetical protein JWP12_3615 [Bacteroidetes bacterium]|nr:hypothetical protein [Bacteroidota bacterium]